MAERIFIRPFEPDLDYTSVGKHESFFKCRVILFLIKKFFAAYLGMRLFYFNAIKGGKNENLAKRKVPEDG